VWREPPCHQQKRSDKEDRDRQVSYKRRRGHKQRADGLACAAPRKRTWV